MSRLLPEKQQPTGTQTTRMNCNDPGAQALNSILRVKSQNITFPIDLQHQAGQKPRGGQDMDVHSKKAFICSRSNAIPQTVE